MDSSILFAWFILVAVIVSVAVNVAASRMLGRHKIRNIQIRAATQVFGTAGLFVFTTVYLYAEGYLDTTINVLGISALIVVAFSKYSPVNNAFSFMIVAYRTEFHIDDWIQISNVNGKMRGKVKDFNLKGVRIQNFSLSESIVSNEELIHSFVVNLTPDDLFRWPTVIRTSKAMDAESVEKIIIDNLVKHNLSEASGTIATFNSYFEYFDDDLDYRPNYRSMTIYTYHPKWIQGGEAHLEPNGFELAYTVTRQLKRDIMTEIEAEELSYVDASLVVQ
jgi:small-conductance mechanosensitive channel